MARGTVKQNKGRAGWIRPPGDFWLDNFQT